MAHLRLRLLGLGLARPVRHRLVAHLQHSAAAPAAPIMIRATAVSEYNNARNNNLLSNFYRRCNTEQGSTPLRTRCSKCCVGATPTRSPTKRTLQQPTPPSLGSLPPNRLTVTFNSRAVDSSTASTMQVCSVCLHHAFVFKAYETFCGKPLPVGPGPYNDCSLRVCEHGVVFCHDCTGHAHGWHCGVRGLGPGCTHFFFGVSMRNRNMIMRPKS